VPHLIRVTSIVVVLCCAVATFAGVVLRATPAQAVDRYHGLPIEGYASWEPQQRCRRTPLPGTVELSRWAFERGGRPGGLIRACGSGGTSEHKDGRAFDWMLDADRRRDAQAAKAFIRALRRTDRAGHADALARRAGVMYVIWDDRIWSSWNRFDPEPYRGHGCRRLRQCSDTLRHRDHVHVSLTRAGARARTSWYAARSR
jgi:hypothetical protein